MPMAPPPLIVNFNIDELPESYTPLAPTTKRRQQSETLINFLRERNLQRNQKNKLNNCLKK